MSAEKVIMEREDGSVRVSKQQDGGASKRLHVSRSAVMGFLRYRCPGGVVVQLSVVACRMKRLGYFDVPRVLVCVMCKRLLLLGALGYSCGGEGVLSYVWGFGMV